MKPQRIQLSRAKGWRKPQNTVVVSRPSKWGNPFKLSNYASQKSDGKSVASDAQAREVAAREFANALAVGGVLPFTKEDVVRELRGKNLACWCPLSRSGEPERCHADVLLRIANPRE